MDKIKVRDAVLEAAQLLGIAEEVQTYLGGAATAAGQRDTDLLVGCFNRIENELALDYLPLTAEEEVVTATGVVEYAALNEKVVRVFCVEDEWGNSIKCRLFPSYLKTSAGKVKIIYAYAPTAKTISGESEYEIGVSLRLFAYGMAAEYSLTTGAPSSAGAWEQKYRDAVRAAYKTTPCKRLRARRWV